MDELELLNPALRKLYLRLIDDIRAVDPDHSIFLNGLIRSTNCDVFDGVMGENTLDSFLINSRHENNSPNPGYVKELDFGGDSSR